MAIKNMFIEFGTNKIKAGIIDSQKDKMNVSQYVIRDTSERAFNLDGEINDVELMETLKTIINDLSAKKSNVSLTITSQKTIIRTREFPVVELDELEKMVRIEAEQFLPYDIESFVVDFKIINDLEEYDESEEENEEKPVRKVLNVMIAAIPVEIVERYINLIESAHLRIESITINSDALYEMSTLIEDIKDKSAVIIDLGQNKTKTLILENGMFFANLHSETGVSNIMNNYVLKTKKTIAEANDFLYKEGEDGEIVTSISNTEDSRESGLEENNQDINKLSEELTSIKAKKEEVIVRSENANEHEEIIDLHELASELTQTIEQENKEVESGDEGLSLKSEMGDAAENHLADFDREIRKIIEFYKTRKYGAKVDVIILCGGGSYIKGISKHVESVTGVKSLAVKDINLEVSGVDKKDIGVMFTALGGAIGR